MGTKSTCNSPAETSSGGARQCDEPLDYKTYLDERKLLSDVEVGVAERFDKGVLTLSGGALLLSMTFVKDIASKPNLTWLLLVSWVLLAGAICLMLTSLLMSQSAIRRQIAILDQSLVKPPAAYQRNRLAGVTNCFNISSIVAFAVAMVFMCVFVAVNLPRK
jgi:hypothetical protein